MLQVIFKTSFYQVGGASHRKCRFQGEELKQLVSDTEGLL